MRLLLWVRHVAWCFFNHHFHLMLRLVSKGWISVGINWTWVVFWPSLSNSWSLFFSFFPSRHFSDLCVFWQAIRVERSRQAPAFLRGEACPPDQWVLDQRTPTLGGSSAPWIPWNAAELERPQGAHGKERPSRGKRYLGLKITSLLWLYTVRCKHAYTPFTK